MSTQENIELFRKDLFSLRQECCLSLAEISELSGFSEEDIRAQEEKTAPHNLDVIVSLSLIYYILILFEDKSMAIEYLRRCAEEI